MVADVRCPATLVSFTRDWSQSSAKKKGLNAWFRVCNWGMSSESQSQRRRESMALTNLDDEIGADSDLHQIFHLGN